MKRLAKEERARLRWFGIPCILLLSMLLVTAGCGEEDPATVFEEPTPEQEAPIEFDVPTPDPGPRYFPPPVGDYFEDEPNIIVFDPDDEERLPLIFSDDTYWLADEHARTIMVYSMDRLEFPLHGNEAMLGYKPGHVILNKYSMIRHYIEEVKVTNDRIVWITRTAELEEYIKEGSLYIDIKPGTDYPIGFDPVDVYLYPNRQAQLEDIERRRLVFNAVGTNEQMLMRTIVQGNSLPVCQLPAIVSPPNDEVPIIACSNYVETNIVDFRPFEDGNHTLCVAAGNTKQVDGEAVCVCDFTDTVAQCQGKICDDICSLGETVCTRDSDCTGTELCIVDEGEIQGICGDYEGPAPPANPNEPGSFGSSFGGSLSFCLNPDTNPDHGNRCPGSVSLKYSSPADGDRAMLRLGPALFNVTIKPIFIATLGFKASFKIKIWKPKAELRVGLYAGVGYGLNAALNLGSLGGNGTYDEVKYWSEIFGRPVATVQIKFLQLQFDPYVRAEVYAASQIGGTIAYEYYNEKWFYACLRVGTSGVKFDSGDSARSKCGLPNMASGSETNGIQRHGFDAEVQAGIVLGLGLEMNLYGVKRTGIWFEPIRLLGNIEASLRGPRCNWSYRLRFGGLFGVGIRIPLIGGISKEWPWMWSFLPHIFNEGAFSGGLWRVLFGCGDYDETEPYQGVVTECPVGASGDALCAEVLTEQNNTDTPARCFVRECVEHGPLRVSLGWFTPGIDASLFIRDPNGNVFHARNSAPEVFRRFATGYEQNGAIPAPRFIENAVFESPANGEYQIWVHRNDQSLSEINEIPYTIEVEREGALGTRQEFSGTLYADRGTVTPTIFTLCGAESDEHFCSSRGLCGLSRGTDNCGNEREIDCGYCSLGAWQQQGRPAAGNWDVAEDNDPYSVFQRINGQPTMYVSQQRFLNSRLTGTFRVQSVSGWNDDDFIGFVFGYNAPLASNNDAHDQFDTMLFSWKQQNQSGAREGKVLAYAKGSNPISWNLAPTNKLKVLATKYGNANLSQVTATNYSPGEGWTYDRDYNFELIYEAHRIRISIDGQQIFDVRAADHGFTEGFPEGRFGFYNHSQPNVRYSNFIAYPLD